MTNGSYSKTAFYTLISVFFFWGFVAASNTILIPIFKKHFALAQWQSQLVDFAFYAAYFVGSLVYFLVSVSAGDPLNKIGYKKGLITGLLISAVGAFGFVPAAAAASFPLMLTSLFIVGLGFALQQIVANPYVIALGDPASGSHRVSLAGGINSFGTTIGPLLLAFAIFGSIHTENVSVDLNEVKTPYAILGLAFIAFALLLWFSKLPPVRNDEKMEHDLGAFKYPQLILGMIAIFIYVGVEVSIQSNLPELMKQPYMLGLESDKTVHFISLYWGSLMIGRWIGGSAVFTLSKKQKLAMKVIAPLAAYFVILFVNYLKGSPLEDIFNYWPVLLIAIGSFIIAGDKPARTMVLFGLLAALAMIIGLMTTGYLALYAFISGGIFCSVMWPCIFSLSLAGLGKYTNQASSLLIMMILGGALIPPLQGFVADKMNIHQSYFIPVLCFGYLAFYGYRVNKELKKQGIQYDDAIAG
jgi:FHS family L-fucose permease-like MFS transporter